MPTAELLALGRRSVDAESLLRSYSLHVRATDRAQGTAHAPHIGHGNGKLTTFRQVGTNGNHIRNVSELGRLTKKI